MKKFLTYVCLAAILFASVERAFFEPVQTPEQESAAEGEACREKQTKPRRGAEGKIKNDSGGEQNEALIRLRDKIVKEGRRREEQEKTGAADAHLLIPPSVF